MTTLKVDIHLNQLLSERRIERVRRVINSWPEWKRDFKLVRESHQNRPTSMKERIAKLRKDPKKSKALDRAAEKIFKELEMIERWGAVAEEAAQPVEPMKVPSDDDLIALALEIAPHATPDHIHKFGHLWVRLCRLALTRYGHPTTTSTSKKGDMRIKDSKLWVCTDPDIDRWACPDGAGWQLATENYSPEEHLMREANKYWKYANTKHNGAVQWIQNDETGELLIFTRGEYREVLMRNIDSLDFSSYNARRGE